MVLPLSLGLPPPRSNRLLEARRLCAPTVKRGARLPLWVSSVGLVPFATAPLYSPALAPADRNRGIVACAEIRRVPPRVRSATCGDGRSARLLYVRRAQRTYSVRPLIQNLLERARTEVKLAPGFLVRSAPKPRRIIDCVGA